MSSVFLPWTTRGLSYETRKYLASVTLDLEELQQKKHQTDFYGGLSADIPFTDAIPLIAKLRTQEAHTGAIIEYGCFDHDGTLIEDPSLRTQRQMRNILYYTIRDYFNTRRNQSIHNTFIPLGFVDPVPKSPKGNWAVLLSENCSHKYKLEQILRPLITHRAGEIIIMPKMDHPQEFLQHWLPKHHRKLPAYLLICDSFENISLEFQFIFNAFAVTGRLWFDTIEEYENYVNKVLSIETGRAQAGSRCVVASPVDDDVTVADYNNIIKSLLEIPKDQSLPLETIVSSDFNEQSVLEAAGSSRFLALYCHGVGLDRDNFEKKPELQGAFVLEFESTSDTGLLVPNEVGTNRFVPGGILFSPACLAGGTMGHSDYVAWIDPDSLAFLVGAETTMSQISQSMLSSPTGPIGVLAHFDISMASSAPMYNLMTKKFDLQKILHSQFIRHLAAGWTLGCATKPFRWAAGIYYAQAIYLFGQMTGTFPYIGISGVRKTIGQAINSMNQYHVIATDMRNYIILGDPAVRLPQN